MNDCRQPFELFAFADVGHQRRFLNLRGLLGQIGKARDQVNRQVVNAVVVQVLKRF